MNDKVHRNEKSHSFIIRSSSIKSKSNHSHTQSESQGGENNNDQFTAIGSANEINNNKAQIEKELHRKDEELKERLTKLNLNLKSLEKKYRENLKEGFDNKIKSYRLQAVMERKLIKETIQETLYMNEIQEINEKQNAALKQRQFNEFNLQRIGEYRDNQMKSLKKKNDLEKKRNYYTISARERELENRNKVMHDRVLDEQKHKDRKRNYLEYYMREKLQREEFESKKEVLERIVANSKKMLSLKEELENIEERCERLFIPPTQLKPATSSTLFVTI